MTSEQIEKLNGTDWAPVHVWRRLLEERSGLLEALKREHESDTGLSQESLAALIFAEEDPLF